MKILIIGNGFDIEHGLPMEYIDFLTQVRVFKENDSNIENLQFIDSVSKFLAALERNEMQDEFSKLVSSNVWLTYFIQQLEQDKLNGRNWIDFEREISDVVADFERQFLEKSEILIANESDLRCLFDPFYFSLSNEVRYEEAFREAYEVIQKRVINKAPEENTLPLFRLIGPLLTEFVEFLFQELRKLTRAFEIYCICAANAVNDDFASENNRKEIKNRINEILRGDSRVNKRTIDKVNEQYKDLCVLKVQDFDYVLSFNYTNTFEILYGNSKTEYCYIHGLAQSKPSGTNMILGIDDSLSERDMNSALTFVKFKKYFQRILFNINTGSEYRNWIKYSEDEVFIVGHSMGETDFDIMREFFNHMSKVQINVFYHDEASKIKLIKRTIEIIGRDNLISRFHEPYRSICFFDQYDEEYGLFKKREAELKRV